MHEYYIRKCEGGKDESLTESKESVKCASLNGKLEAEIISVCCLNLGWS